MSPDGAPGAGEAIPVAEATVADQAAELTTTTTAEAGASSDPVVESGEPAGIDATTDADTTAAAADDADLAQYPESVRDDFKALTPEKRKALYEEAEKRVSEKITRERERNDKLESDRKAAEAKRKEILSKTGEFVGAEARTIKLQDGTEKALPSYDELVQLSQTRRGRDVLYEKYGLDEDATEAQRQEWDERRTTLDAAADLLDDQAWAKLDVNLRDGMREEGLDPDSILNDAKSPRDVVKQLLTHERAKHAAEVKKLKDGYEGRIGALTANQEGLAGRALAGSARGMAEGGRSAGGGAMTLDDFRALPPEERQKMRREQSALVDRLYAQGQAARI